MLPSATVNVFRDTHPRNDPPVNFSTPAGSSMVVMAQFSKAPKHMCLRESGTLTVFKEWQSLKTSLDRRSTPRGIVTFFREEQFWKAPFPMLLTLSGSISSFRHMQPSNA